MAALSLLSSANSTTPTSSSSATVAITTTTTSTSSNSPAVAAAAAVTLLSRCTVYPDHRPSTLGDLPLSVSDLPMLSCHYIQKGLFFPPAPAAAAGPPPSATTSYTSTPTTNHIPNSLLIPHLRASLAQALSLFPALAGRLITAPDGRVLISCNDAGVDFYHAAAPSLTLPGQLSNSDHDDVPAPLIDLLFSLHGAISYSGHFLPLAAFQVTELRDGALFVACTVNHAVVDGTSFWHFFNTWAALCRRRTTTIINNNIITTTNNNNNSGSLQLHRPEMQMINNGALLLPRPDFQRNFFGDSKAVLRFPGGRGPEMTFPLDAPLRERIFHFTPEAIRELKSRANRRRRRPGPELITRKDVVQLIVDDQGAAVDDRDHIHNTHRDHHEEEQQLVPAVEISSFQSLCALLWQSVTRARMQQLYLRAEAPTTFRMAVNCRRRVVPQVDPYYFGNAIQSIPTTAAVGEVAGRDVAWTAAALQRSVAGHGDAAVRRVVAEWEAAPRCFPLGNPDGAGLTMGSSPRFPMYAGNDFGWGKPVAVRSGRANKFDGKISAFPGREGGGSVDLEVVLAPETMAALLLDDHFMSYVSPAPLTYSHRHSS